MNSHAGSGKEKDSQFVRKLLDASEKHNKNLGELITILKKNLEEEKSKCAKLMKENQDLKQELGKRSSSIKALEKELQATKARETAIQTANLELTQQLQLIHGSNNISIQNLKQLENTNNNVRVFSDRIDTQYYHSNQLNSIEQYSSNKNKDTYSICNNNNTVRNSIAAINDTNLKSKLSGGALSTPTVTTQNDKENNSNTPQVFPLDISTYKTANINLLSQQQPDTKRRNVLSVHQTSSMTPSGMQNQVISTLLNNSVDQQLSTSAKRRLQEYQISNSKKQLESQQQQQQMFSAQRSSSNISSNTNLDTAVKSGQANTGLKKLLDQQQTNYKKQIEFQQQQQQQQQNQQDQSVVSKNLQYLTTHNNIPSPDPCRLGTSGNNYHSNNAHHSRNASDSILTENRSQAIHNANSIYNLTYNNYNNIDYPMTTSSNIPQANIKSASKDNQHNSIPSSNSQQPQPATTNATGVSMVSSVISANFGYNSVTNMNQSNSPATTAGTTSCKLSSVLGFKMSNSSNTRIDRFSKQNAIKKQQQQQQQYQQSSGSPLSSYSSSQSLSHQTVQPMIIDSEEVRSPKFAGNHKLEGIEQSFQEAGQINSIFDLGGLESSINNFKVPKTTITTTTTINSNCKAPRTAPHSKKPSERSNNQSKNQKPSSSEYLSNTMQALFLGGGKHNSSSSNNKNKQLIVGNNNIASPYDAGNCSDILDTVANVEEDVDEAANLENLSGSHFKFALKNSCKNLRIKTHQYFSKIENPSTVIDTSKAGVLDNRMNQYNTNNNLDDYEKAMYSTEGWCVSERNQPISTQNSNNNNNNNTTKMGFLKPPTSKSPSTTTPCSLNSNRSQSLAEVNTNNLKLKRPMIHQEEKEPGRLKKRLELTQSTLGSNLCEGLIIFGADQQNLNDISSHASNQDALILKPHVLYKSPHETRDQVLMQFAFPFGINATPVDNPRRIRSIVIDDGNYQESQLKYNQHRQPFVFAVKSEQSYHQPKNNNGQQQQNLLDVVNPSKLLYAVCLQASAIAINQDNQCYETDRMYCFLTYYPFHSFFIECMQAVIKLTVQKRIQGWSQILERSPNQDDQLLISQLQDDTFEASLKFEWREMLQSLIQLPIPRLSSTLELLFHNDHLSFPIGSLKSAEHIEAQFGSSNLLKILKSQEFLVIFLAMLLETSIVFVSSNPSMLSSAMLMFHSLLKPFKWHHPLIFNLPHEFMHVLDIPVPILVGINRDKAFIVEQHVDGQQRKDEGYYNNDNWEKTESQNLIQKHENCLFVVIEQDHIEFFNEHLIQHIYQSKIFDDLQTRLKGYFDSNDLLLLFPPHSNRSNNLSPFSNSSPHYSSNKPINLYGNQNAETNSLRILQCCTEYIQHNIVDAMPTIPPMQQNTTKMLDFDAIEDKIIQQLGQDDNALRTLLKTQHFAVFAEELYDSQTN